MTEEEIKEKAIKNYPIGTKFKSLYKGNEEMYILKHTFTNTYKKDEVWFTCSLLNDGCADRNGIVYNFKTNIWAEIISYPEGYNPEQNLLKELVIW